MTASVTQMTPISTNYVPLTSTGPDSGARSCHKRVVQLMAIVSNIGKINTDLLSSTGGPVNGTSIMRQPNL